MLFYWKFKIKDLTIGIDASRNRSGGAKTHLVGLLVEGSLPPGIKEVHVWSYKTLLNQLPNASWLVKHTPPALEKSIFHQLLWQYFNLPKEVKKNNCQILLNTSAGTVCPFHPCITMSRDMLSFEKKEIRRFRIFSKEYLRLIVLRYIQTSSLKKADGVIFLTNYAATTIQKHIGKLRQVKIIPHGISSIFSRNKRNISNNLNTPIRCVYVSNAAMYKHQWHVIKATAMLKATGYDISLTLVGGGSGLAKRLMNNEINRSDPNRKFTELVNFTPHNELPAILRKADIFIFASSCENMPNTLVEAMASGLPIACSDRGPMPEILQNGGIYFNPEDPADIAKAVEKLVNDSELRTTLVQRSQKLSEQYSWQRCAKETFQFLIELAKDSNA